MFDFFVRAFLRCVCVERCGERVLRLKPVRRRRRGRFLFLHWSTGRVVHVVGAARHRADQNELVGFQISETALRGVARRGVHSAGPTHPNSVARTDDTPPGQRHNKIRSPSRNFWPTPASISVAPRSRSRLGTPGDCGFVRW